MHEHVGKRRDLLAVLEQLRQIVGNALRVDHVHFRHFHGNPVRRRRRASMLGHRTVARSAGNLRSSAATVEFDGVACSFGVGCQTGLDDIFRGVYGVWYDYTNALSTR